MEKHSVKSIILGSIVAVALALIQPAIFTFSIMVCVTPVLISVLYAWGGVIPAAIASAGTVLSLAGFASAGGAISPALAGLGAAIALVAPAWASVYLMEKRLPFFRRMLISVGVQTAGLFICVSYVYLVMKIDLVDLFTGFMRTSVEYLPEDMVMGFLQACANYGMLTEESIAELTGGIILRSDVMKVFDQVFELVNYQFKQTMPAMLLGSGLISGMMETFYPSMICVRRGDKPVIPHVPLYGWFLPAHLVSGIAICLISSWVLQLMNMDSAVAVTVVFRTLSSYLFIVQGLAAIDRRFREAGAGRGMRIGMMIAGVVAASWFVELYGTASALFGRKGIFSQWMRKKMEDMEKNRKDDEE